MNKYQKHLNMRSKRLFKSQEEHYSYRECRNLWRYALKNYSHYIIMLKELHIVKR